MIFKRFLIKTITGVKLLRMKKIVWMESDNGYTTLYMKNGKKYTISGSIKRHYDVLRKYYRFVRIHRSYAVNLKYVDELVYNSHIVLRCKTKLPITSDGEKALLAHFPFD